MGVPKLWELLAASGRRVSLDSLFNQRLAVDVSIWLVGFLQGSASFRDDISTASGSSSARVAHLAGLMRRCCKLLAFGVRPVIVFDGATPALKMKTLEARRRRRDSRPDAEIKKVARRLAKLHKSRGSFSDLPVDVDNATSASAAADVDNATVSNSTTSTSNSSSISNSTAASCTAATDSINCTTTSSSSSACGACSSSSPLALSGSPIARGSCCTSSTSPTSTGSEGGTCKTGTHASDPICVDDFDVSAYGEEPVEGSSDESLFFAATGFDENVLKELPEEIQLELLLKFQQGRKQQAHQRAAFYTHKQSGISPDSSSSFSEQQVASLLQDAALTTRIKALQSHTEEGFQRINSDSTTEYLLQHTPLEEDLLGPQTSSTASTSQNLGKKAISNVSTGNNGPCDTGYIQGEVKTESEITPRIRPPAHSIADPGAPKRSRTTNYDVSDYGDIIISINPAQAKSHPLFHELESLQNPLTTLCEAATNLSHSAQKPTSTSTSDVKARCPLLTLADDEIEWETEEAPVSVPPPAIPTDVSSTAPLGEEYDHDLQLALQLSLSECTATTSTTNDPSRVAEPDALGLPPELLEEDKLARTEFGLGLTHSPKFRDTTITAFSASSQFPCDLESHLTEKRGHAACTNILTADFLESGAEILPSPQHLEAPPKKTSTSSSHLLSLDGHNAGMLSTNIVPKSAETTLNAEITAECQELLHLFGIPFLLAPMEAEAQCAFLDSMGLVDGVISDDSDTLLFGVKNVYRRLFDSANYPELYNSKKIEETLGLDRDSMIELALLVGSDYTEGVSGIGIVKALSIISEFPNLEAFRDWVTASSSNAAVTTTAPPKALKSLRGKLQLSPGFPSKAVYDAYLNPVVDHSHEGFTWGTPNFKALREFARDRIGWADDVIEKVIKPVELKLAVHQQMRQTRIDEFVFCTQEEQALPAPLITPKVNKILTHLKKKNKSTHNHET
ncbi:DNA repair protein complementing XP-G cells-like [Pelomyxa schiedti]|nr:DNA repair protein complementing XP-G cells-like [Pelomyxa schiedti]